MVKFLEANVLLALIYTCVFFVCPTCGSSAYTVYLCIPLWSILCSIWWHDCFWWYKKPLGLQLLHVRCLKNRSSTTNTQGSALHSFVIFILVPVAVTEYTQWIHCCVTCTPITLFPVLCGLRMTFHLHCTSFLYLFDSGWNQNTFWIKKCLKNCPITSMPISLVVIVFFSCYKNICNVNCGSIG